MNQTRFIKESHIRKQKDPRDRVSLIGLIVGTIGALTWAFSGKPGTYFGSRYFEIGNFFMYFAGIAIMLIGVATIILAYLLPDSVYRRLKDHREDRYRKSVKNKLDNEKH